ncbi:MAG: hypothetical protein U1F83_02240 [Verrucomicrobiota bacterium]
MNIPVILILGFVTLLPAAAGETAGGVPTNAPATISLRDQFDAPQTLAFPTTNVLFFAIADQKGSEQIAGWVAPVKDRFQERVAIYGIADVSAVPRPLRGLVRKKFKQAQSHPVMLDWTGTTVKAFGCANNAVNVFVVDGEGGIQMRVVGPATEGKLRDLFAVLDQTLGRKDHVVAK